MKSDLCFHYGAKARPFIAAACHYVFFSAFLNKHCSGLIVYPRLLESRDESGQLILHVHDGLTLTLEKSTVLAKDLQFVSSSSTDSYIEILNGEELERNLYHDSMRTSSLIVDQAPGGGVHVRGILDNRFRIAPHSVSSRSALSENAHEIVSVEESTTSHEDTNESTESDYEQQCDPKDFANRTVNPTTHERFVVEVCLVTSDSYANAFNTRTELVQYLAALTNAVQLRYTNMTSPEIFLQLNELRVVQGEDLLGNESCVEYNYGGEDGENTTLCGLDAEATLNKTTEYINACVTANCDIVYVVVSNDLTYMNNGTLSTEVQGIAEIGGVCSAENVALGEDIPTLYSGIITMAHEIGHMLGSDHDGCPNATNCSAEYGNLMSSVDRGMENKSILSECTMQQIRYLVRRLPDSCIYVNTTARIPNYFYPGDNITDEELCNLTHPDIPVVLAHKNGTLKCQITCCWNETDDEDIFASDESEDSSTTDMTTDYHDEIIYESYCGKYDRLDGMTCDTNKTCYKGVCGNHSWDEIRRKYHTNRTFQDIPQYVTSLYNR